MKLFIFVLVFTGLYFHAKGQYKIVESEFGLSYPLIVTKVYNPQTVAKSPGVYLEIRINIPTTHFSVGSQLYIASWDVVAGEHKKRLGTIAITSLFDYNINLTRGLQLFVGTGIGIADIGETKWRGDSSTDIDRPASVFIAPRIGLEAWNRVRFALSYNLTSRDYSGLVLKCGFVIGGGKSQEIQVNN